MRTPENIWACFRWTVITYNESQRPWFSSFTELSLYQLSPYIFFNYDIFYSYPCSCFTSSGLTGNIWYSFFVIAGVISFLIQPFWYNALFPKFYKLLPSLQQTYKFSAFALVIGFFMKWYLILLLPVFLVYYYSSYKKVNWSMIVVFVLTSLITITSTILWTGVEGFLVPYKMQLGRGMD
jgi:hypothetical protein